MRRFTVVLADEERQRDPERSWVSVARTFPGLLFESDTSIDAGVIKQIITSPLVNAFFPVAYLNFRTTHRVVISGVAPLDPPDAATYEDYVNISIEGREVALSLRRRFNDCRELTKYMYGCAECSDRGFTCLYRSEPQLQPAVDHMDTLLRFCKWTEDAHATCAGFEYVSPALTKTENFQRSLRRAEAHDLSDANVEEWRDRRSRGSRRAARTRAFQREHCADCAISSHCTEYRWCPGPYPTAPTAIDQVLEKWLPRLERSNIPEWKFWYLARSAGQDEFTYGRCKTVLMGWEWDGTAFILRAMKSRQGVKFRIDEVDLAKHIHVPQSPTVVRYPKMIRRPTDLETALYFMSLSVDEGPRKQGHGWGYAKPWSVLYRRPICGGVQIGWQDGRRPRGTELVTSFGRFYATVRKNLPNLTKLHVRERSLG